MPLGVEQDGFGNLWKVVGESPILFSCHTDTVHKQAGRQPVVYGDGIATATGSNCLGADDTTGVWLMVNMIREGVPGTYVFHSAEEIGGQGSKWVRQHTPEKLKGIKFAIAFDRMGHGDIITHQMDGRTASDDFALSMAALLHPLPYKASEYGTFTDTMNYADLVPECSNISVGYFDQHHKEECQDCVFAMALLRVLLDADWGQLVAKRQPGDYDDALGSYFPAGTSKTFGSLYRYCKQYPDTVADFLESLGYDVNDIEEYIWGSEDRPLQITKPEPTRLIATTLAQAEAAMDDEEAKAEA